MKCEICGDTLRAELAITEPGWIIFHECIVRGNTEQETIDNYEKIRVSAHNSDYAVQPTASPKLPSVDDIFKYLGKTNDTDKLIIKVYLDAIKSLGNFA